MAELMPITSPLVLTSAPPELPGLIGASVCSRPEIEVAPALLRAAAERAAGSAAASLLDWMVRSLALMMPAVTEPCRPSGLPRASTVSPTCIGVAVAELRRLEAVETRWP